jgi:hypothetical protein
MSLTAPQETFWNTAGTEGSRLPGEISVLYLMSEQF